MLEALTGWMQGPYAGKTMLVLRALFFLLFIATALLLALPGRDSLRRGVAAKGVALLSVLTVLGFAAVFACQARWQLFGARDPGLMRFMRRHNTRPSVDVRRGSILDRNGSVLAIDDPESASLGRRRYPLGAVAAHVVGYFDPRYGMTGVEKAADTALTGVGNSALEELGRLGRSIVDSAPAEGRDVKLTLDARLQRAAAKAMEGRRGAVVALNPATGEILALYSAPGFDPSEPGLDYGDADDAPFLNRATQGKYPPGSTFKVAMALMAADMGLAPVYDCPASGFKAAKDAKAIRDSEYYAFQRQGKTWKGFGKLGLKMALVHSSNVYFAQLGHRIPAEKFNAYVAALGITGPVPLFFSEDGGLTAPSGVVPEVSDTDRKARSQLAIGQGAMAVSPLDVAMWTSVVANGGVLKAPRLEYGAPEGRFASRRVFSAAAAENVAGMMRAAVLSGTGKNAEVPGLGVCGKTGTAQNPRGDDHSWFTCFTSSASPRLVVTVLVENGGFGAKNALPVAKGVLESAVKFGIVKPAGGGK